MMSGDPAIIDRKPQGERTLEGFARRPHGSRQIPHQNGAGAIDKQGIDRGPRILGHRILRQFGELGSALGGGGSRPDPRGGGIFGKLPVHILGEQRSQARGVARQPGGEELPHDGAAPK